MNDYIEVRLDIEPCSEAATDVMAALLADAGGESFVADEKGLSAYFPARNFDSAAIDAAIAAMPLPVEVRRSDTTIAGRDWNAEWERNYFQPIVIGDTCCIHSSFHRDYPRCRYDITIDPKMAFGTGHHATTSLIVAQLTSMDIAGRQMLDMGTGTGILAILGAMRGANPVTAIEIDPPAWENACVNVGLNGHPEIDVKLGDAALLDGITGIGLFVANINRNVITGDIAAYAATLAPAATMLLSGFYVDDIPVVRAAAEAVGLNYDSFTERDCWACLKLTMPR